MKSTTVRDVWQRQTYGMVLLVGCSHPTRLCLLSNDLDRLDRIVLSDVVKYFKTLRIIRFDTAKYRMYTVKVRARYKTDEKLASACVWTRMSHGERAASVAVCAGVCFAVDAPLRAACAWHTCRVRACIWASALRHETRDDPVEL